MEPLNLPESIRRSTVIICRGCPGSGKDYMLNELIRNLPPGISHEVCSADHFFIRDGQYIFNRGLLGVAHRCCLSKYIRSLELGVLFIAISNTNLTWNECKDYIEYATIMGADIYLAEPQTSWRYDPEECFRRNQHGVPLENLQKMRARFHPNSHIIEQAQLQYGITIKEWQHGYAPISSDSISNYSA